MHAVMSLDFKATLLTRYIISTKDHFSMYCETASNISNWYPHSRLMDLFDETLMKLIREQWEE